MKTKGVMKSIFLKSANYSFSVIHIADVSKVLLILRCQGSTCVNPYPYPLKFENKGRGRQYRKGGRGLHKIEGLRNPLPTML